jgi:hypothetical protein
MTLSIERLLVSDLMTHTHGTEIGLMPHSRHWSSIMVVIVSLLLGAECGGSDETSAAPISAPKMGLQRQGPLKAIKWDVARVRDQSIQIGAFVPYCEYTKPVPRVERVIQRRRPGRIILTMLVRFPLNNAGPEGEACLGVQISVFRWVKLDQDPQRLRLFDGKSSPPREVEVHM